MRPPEPVKWQQPVRPVAGSPPCMHEGWDPSLSPTSPGWALLSRKPTCLGQWRVVEKGLDYPLLLRSACTPAWWAATKAVSGAPYHASRLGNPLRHSQGRPHLPRESLQTWEPGQGRAANSGLLRTQPESQPMPSNPWHGGSVEPRPGNLVSFIISQGLGLL